MDKEFAESYNTTKWQRKKNSILERDNYTCQICGNTTGVMQVHHITYEHCNGKAYNAPDEDLITLCCDCHNHDDGDHIHFFNGEYTLIAGTGKPEVYSEKKLLCNAKTIYRLLDDIMVVCERLLTDLKYAEQGQNISQRKEDIIAWVEYVQDRCFYLASRYIDM